MFSFISIKYETFRVEMNQNNVPHKILFIYLPFISKYLKSTTQQQQQQSVQL